MCTNRAYDFDSDDDCLRCIENYEHVHHSDDDYPSYITSGENGENEDDDTDESYRQPLSVYDQKMSYVGTILSIENGYIVNLFNEEFGQPFSINLSTGYVFGSSDDIFFERDGEQDCSGNPVVKLPDAFCYLTHHQYKQTFSIGNVGGFNMAYRILSPDGKPRFADVDTYRDGDVCKDADFDIEICVLPLSDSSVVPKKFSLPLTIE